MLIDIFRWLMCVLDSTSLSTHDCTHSFLVFFMFVKYLLSYLGTCDELTVTGLLQECFTLKIWVRIKPYSRGFFFAVELACDFSLFWSALLGGQGIEKNTVCSLPFTLHVGSSELNPIWVKVNNLPTWQAFDNCEEEFPSCV